MRKILGAIFVIFVILVSTMVFAQEVTELEETEETVVYPGEYQTFGDTLKLQCYAEYINFTGGAIKGDTWGGGILARYIFLDWLRVQTNLTFYSPLGENYFGKNLDFANWRLSFIFHTYDDILNPLYLYGGGGFGVQFNGTIDAIDVTLDVESAITGHVLIGIGYEITKMFNIEAECGRQFGSTGMVHYPTIDIDLDAFFVRFGGGIRF